MIGPLAPVQPGRARRPTHGRDHTHACHALYCALESADGSALGSSRSDCPRTDTEVSWMSGRGLTHPCVTAATTRGFTNGPHFEGDRGTRPLPGVLPLRAGIGAVA